MQMIDENRSFVCSTNMFHTEKMRRYNNLPEDIWQAKERYQTMTVYLSQNIGRFTLADVQGLLAGKEGFICQYDRKTGKDTV